MALWDICGKALGEPVWRLLGGAKQPHLRPYASLLPEGATVADYTRSLVDKAVQAVEYGFGAVKAEVCLKGPYSHMGLQESDETIVEVVQQVRSAVGPEITLMVDVAYAWTHYKEALRVIRQLEPLDIYFIETPLRSDDISGYAALAQATDVRIAAGEWLSSRFEFCELIDHGRIDVAQPDVGRVGWQCQKR